MLKINFTVLFISNNKKGKINKFKVIYNYLSDKSLLINSKHLPKNIFIINEYVLFFRIFYDSKMTMYKVNKIL